MKTLFIVIIGFILSGCTTVMSPKVKNKLEKIIIDEKIIVPKDIFFMTKGEALTSGMVGLTGMVFENSDTTEEEKFIYFLKRNKINFANMIKKEYAVALKSKPFYYNRLTTNNNDYNYKFKITINMYGLIYYASIFGVDYNPTAKITIDLVDKNENTIWSDWAYVSSYTDNIPKMPLKEYFNNPNNLREAFNKTAKIITKMIVEKLP